MQVKRDEAFRKRYPHAVLYMLCLVYYVDRFALNPQAGQT